MSLSNIINPTERVTRSFGLLETFLAKKRAKQANSFIDDKLRNGRILDIGCGCFPYFLNATKFKEKYGIDNHAPTDSFKNKSIHLKKIDFEKEKIPFGDGYFDAVTMLAVFEHLNPKNFPFVFTEIYRVLKKNGSLILTTPSPWSAPVLFVLSKIGFISKTEINDHKNSLNSKKIINFLVKSGFNQTKINSGYFELFFNMWIVGKK